MIRPLTVSETHGAISLLHKLNKSGKDIIRGLAYYSDPTDDVQKTIRNNERLIIELTSALHVQY